MRRRHDCQPTTPVPSSFAPSRLQAIEWVNLCVLTPFAILAIPAFLRGWEWARIPAIVVSSFTPYSLVLCMGSTM